MRKKLKELLEEVALIEREIPYLTTYLRYLQGIRAYIYTTNALERFIKEVGSVKYSAQFF